jgi:hypothetical protein
MLADFVDLVVVVFCGINRHDHCACICPEPRLVEFPCTSEILSKENVVPQRDIWRALDGKGDFFKLGRIVGGLNVANYGMKQQP